MLFVPMKPIYKYKAKILIIWLLAFTSNILIFGLFIRHRFVGMANKAFWQYTNEIKYGKMLTKLIQSNNQING